MIVSEAAYEVTDPDRRLARSCQLQGARAPTCSSTSRRRSSRAQAIKQGRTRSAGSRCTISTTSSSSVGSVLTPAGLENSVGHASTAHTARTRPTRSGRTTTACKIGGPSWASTIRAATSRTRATSTATRVAQTVVQVLKQCGDDLTRENVMKQAASLKHGAAAVVAGHQREDRAERLLPDRARAAGALRRQDLGAVRQGVRPGGN